MSTAPGSAGTAASGFRTGNWLPAPRTPADDRYVADPTEPGARCRVPARTTTPTEEKQQR